MDPEKLVQETGVEETATTDETPDVDPVIEKARSKGWVDLEEWVAQGKDEHQWVDADEFLRREPLFDKIHSIMREKKKLEEAIRTTHEHYRKLMQREREEMMRQLNEARKMAFEEHDYDRLVEIEQNMEKLKEEEIAEKLQTQYTASQPDPTFQEWVAKNPWYTQNQKLRFEADSVGQLLLMEIQQGLRQPFTGTDEFYEAVRDEMARRYPAEVGGRKTTTAAVETSKKTTTPKKRKMSFKDLPAEVRRLARPMIESGAITEEQYVEDYMKMEGM